MPLEPNPAVLPAGHALRNARLRERALRRAEAAPPLARLLVTLRAQVLGLTRLDLARQSGVSRGTLRDVELGVHTPTRRILQRLLDFFDGAGVPPACLEELRRLYAGSGDTLGQFLARLELRAGSSRELARRVGISPATLWEYQRGNFPLPWDMLLRLCEAVDVGAAEAEPLWRAAERERLLGRGYPEALAEFWLLCGRAGHSERHLPALGMSSAALRRLRYLELPPWPQVADAARRLCDGDELANLERLWRRDEAAQCAGLPDEFGARLQRLRKRQGISRRELADLFGVGGKKPARIVKYIEEDGFYSAQAYPAGLAALLAAGDRQRDALLAAWRERRRQFHRRHRPETRIDLRLARELYGFGPRDLEPILGYTALEYQKIERGVTPLGGHGPPPHPGRRPRGRPEPRRGAVRALPPPRGRARRLAPAAVGVGADRSAGPPRGRTDPAGPAPEAAARQGAVGGPAAGRRPRQGGAALGRPRAHRRRLRRHGTRRRAR